MTMDENISYYIDLIKNLIAMGDTDTASDVLNYLYDIGSIGAGEFWAYQFSIQKAAN